MLKAAAATDSTGGNSERHVSDFLAVASVVAADFRSERLERKGTRRLRTMAVRCRAEAFGLSDEQDRALGRIESAIAG